MGVTINTHSELLASSAAFWIASVIPWAPASCTTSSSLKPPAALPASHDQYKQLDCSNNAGRIIFCFLHEIWY